MKSAFVLVTLVAMVTALQYEDIHSDSSGTASSKSRKSSTMDENLGSNKPTPPGEDNKEFWLELARSELLQRVEKTLNTNQAKNVIFFLGDGMSLTTVTASRIRKGQLKGNPGEEDQLSFEKFPYAGLSRVRQIYELR